MLVIVEYCCYGNLQNYMIRNRNRFINQVDSHGYMNPSIGVEKFAEANAMYVYHCIDLYRYSIQLCHFIIKNRIIHRFILKQFD